MRALSLAIVALLTSSSLAHAGKNKHLQDAVAAARSLRPYSDRADVNLRPQTVIRGLQYAKSCFEAIDAAVEAGASMTEEFKSDRSIAGSKSQRGPRGGRTYTTNLVQLRKHCTLKSARVQLGRAYLAMNAAYHQSNRLSRAKTVYDLKLASSKQRACAHEVGKALQLKDNKPSIALQRPDTTLGEAQAKVCNALAVGIAAARKRVIAKTNLSGFSAALQGDRLKVLRDNLLFDGDTYGSEKFPLKDTEDFAYSDVWYEVYKGTNELLQASWTVRIYRFKDAKLLGTTIKRGDGDAPPKALFK